MKKLLIAGFLALTIFLAPSTAYVNAQVETLTQEELQAQYVEALQTLIGLLQQRLEALIAQLEAKVDAQADQIRGITESMETPAPEEQVSPAPAPTPTDTNRNATREKIPSTAGGYAHSPDLIEVLLDGVLDDGASDTYDIKVYPHEGAVYGGTRGERQDVALEAQGAVSEEGCGKVESPAGTIKSCHFRPTFDVTGVNAVTVVVTLNGVAQEQYGIRRPNGSWNFDAPMKWK